MLMMRRLVACPSSPVPISGPADADDAQAFAFPPSTS